MRYTCQKREGLDSKVYTSLESDSSSVVQMESDGYATVAISLAEDPDKETYVFRRFDRLTARKVVIWSKYGTIQVRLHVLEDLRCFHIVYDKHL